MELESFTTESESCEAEKKKKKQAHSANLYCRAKSSRSSLRAEPIAVKHIPSHIAIIFSPTRRGKIFGHNWKIRSHRKARRQHVWEKGHWGRPPGIPWQKEAFRAEDRTYYNTIIHTMFLMSQLQEIVWPYNFNKASLIWSVIRSSVNFISSTW